MTDNLCNRLGALGKQKPRAGAALRAGWSGPWATGPTEPSEVGKPSSDPAAASLGKS